MRIVAIFRFLCTLSVILGSILFSGCGKKEKPKVIVGLESDFPPYEYYSGNKIQGIDPEILQIAAQRFGWELVMVDMNFDTLLEALQSGRIDVAASALSVTPARKERVNLTETYAHAGLMTVLPLHSTVQSIDELKGKLIGVQRGSTGDEYVTKNIQIPSRFPNVETAAKNLREGKIDAFVVDSGPASLLVRQYKNLKLMKPSLTREEYAIAVRKDRTDLLKKLNTVIRELKQKGQLTAIREKHELLAAAILAKNTSAPLPFRVAIDPTFPPIGYIRNGKPDGIEIELLDRIAAELGRVASYEQVGFDSLFEAVENDNGIDIGAGSISISKERAQIVNFTIPYFETCQHFFVRKDSPVKKPEDLKGKKIGAIYCTTAEKYIRKNFEPPECYSEGILLFKALSEGKIDAALMDRDPAEIFMKKFKNIRKLPDVLLQEEYGFAVRKEKRELLKQINEVLLRFHSDGTVRQIRDRHFQIFQNGNP